jgi:hypothetical protein
MSSAKAFRRSTAYHEAGHAVIAFVGESPVGDISIIRDGPDRGRTELPLPDDFDPAYCDDASRRTVLEPWILAKHAGQAAERKAMGRTHRVRGARLDREQAEEAAEWVTFSDQERRAYLRWLGARAVELVEREWDAIEGLASRLLAVGSMNASKAPEAAYGGL